MEREDSPQRNHRNNGEFFSVIALVFAMLMAVGPGVLLINRPETFLGIPLVYSWGILWYIVICCIALVTDHYIWSKDVLVDKDQDGSS